MVVSRIEHLFLIVFLIPALSVSGQIPPEIVFDTAYTRTVLNELASPDFAGRGYVSNGDKKAAEYIRNEFEGSGIRFFDDNPYQEFSFSVNTFPGVMHLTLCDKELTPGYDYMVHPGSPPIGGSHKVHPEPVNKPGFICFSEKSLDLTLGKKELDSLALLYDKVTGIMVIKRAKLTWWVSTTVLDIPVILLSEATDPGSCGLLDLNIHSERIMHSTQNVVGYLPGKDSSEHYILITGHYDHLGMMGKDALFSGANDNASGIALMLTLARHYSEPGNSPPCPIVFMAFAGEEAGLIGSEYYVKNPLFPLERIRFLVNLDLMGTGEDGITVVNGSVHKDEFEMLTQLNDAANYFDFVGERGKAANSDHYHFSEKGVPSFFIYTMGSRKAYHDINDVPETVEFPKVSESLQLISSFIKRLCTDSLR